MAGVHSMVASALAAIDAEINATSSENEYEGIQQLYRNTVRTFTRSPQASGSSGIKRGRGCHKNVVLIRMFLLEKPAEAVPSPYEQKKLTQKGLGSPKMSSKYCTLKRSWTIKDLESYIISLYPGVCLDLTGFYFGKSGKNRNLKKIDFESVSFLKKALNRGKLFIIPKSQITEETLEISSSTVESSSTPNKETQLPRTATTSCTTNPRPGSSQTSDEPDIIVRSNQDDLPDIQRSRNSGLSRRRRRNVSTIASPQILERSDEAPVGNTERQQFNNLSESIVEQEAPVGNTERQQFNNLSESIVEQEREELEDRRRVIRCQDTEYQKSLEDDQEKDRQKAEDCSRKEEEEKEKTRIQELRARRKRMLPMEPDQGFNIKVRSMDGSMYTRKFTRESSVQILHNFIGSIEDSTEHFKVIGPETRTIYSSSMNGRCTMLDIGISVNTVLNVTWLNEAPVNTNHVEDCDFEDLGSPTVSIRIRPPRREAAEIARIQVQEWTQAVGRPSETQTSENLACEHPENTNPNIIFQEMSDDEFETKIDLTHTHEDLDEPYLRQPPTESCLSSAMKSLAEIVLGDNKDMRLNIIVRRSSALTDALNNIGRAQSRLLQPLSVRFIAEPAVDDGGPSRELSSEMIAQIMKSSFVEGAENNKVFRNDFTHYNSKKFLHLGQLTAILLLQGGLGLPVFCHSVVKYILSEEISNTAEDLPENIREAIEKLNDMSDADMKDNIDRLLPARFEEGYPLPSNRLTRQHLPQIIQAMVAYHIIQPQKLALDQFVQGLHIAGVLETLRQFPTESAVLFKGSLAKMSMHVIEGMVTFNYSNIDAGSNRMEIAKGIEAGWMLLLQAAESGEAEFEYEGLKVDIHLSDILKWLTGASHFPAIGLPKIQFKFDRYAKLPKVNTCSLEVYLPLLQEFEDPQTVAKKIAEWMTNSYGFGLI